MSITGEETYPKPAQESAQLIVEADPAQHEIMRPAETDERYIATGYLNIFSQQRPGENQQQEALKSTLRRRQINSINVRLACEELVKEYLDFTDKTWGSCKRQEELISLPEGAGENGVDEGKYIILIAGHSRVKGIRGVAT